MNAGNARTTDRESRTVSVEDTQIIALLTSLTAQVHKSSYQTMTILIEYTQTEKNAT